MAVIGLALVRVRDLFAVVMLSGLFTLTAASLYVVMDAVDVAFTEAAVGPASPPFSCSKPWP